MNKKELQTVILAGLLHDIGKCCLWKSDIKEIFKQERLRGHGHAKWSADFVDNHLPNMPELIDMVLYHGQPNKEKDYNNNIRDENKILSARLIKIADELSSKERRKEEESEVVAEEESERIERSEIPLLSVFNEINLGLNPTREIKQAFQLKPLTNEKDVLFPVLNYPGEKLPPDAYPQICKKLDEEFRMLKSPPDVITILHLLYKYIWCTPSATPAVGIKPDVSLYDHARTTAAIAACLYSNYTILTGNTAETLLSALTEDFKIKIGKKQGPISQGYKQILKRPLFILLVGDMFGTQNYIYAPSNIPGTSKRLRGRSFYLYLLTEIIARYIVYHPQINLSLVNILYCAGGNFHILLPHTSEIVKEVDAIIKEVNQRLFRIFRGKLGFVFAQLPVSAGDFNNWDDVLKRAEDRLGAAKRQKLNSLLMENPEAVLFPGEEIPGRKDLCKSCGDTIPYSENENEQICPMCKIHAELGQKLPKAVGLLFYQGEGSIESCNASFESYELNIADIGRVALIVRRADAQEKPQLRVKGSLSNIEYYQLNETGGFVNAADIENGTASFGFKFIGNVVPLEQDGSVMEFERIADASEGAKKLGVLKMDVDNLGLILQIGLSAGEESDRTISRLATLSRTMELFFSGYIHKICEKFKNIYIIYSGGDDLLIVGPWSEIPHLAQSIYQEFREYTCQNEDITLSAGIFLCDPKFPVKRFAPLVSEELSQSKTWGKNRCTTFGSTVVWQKSSHNVSDVISYDELIAFGKQLYEYVEQNKIARGFLHQLLRLHHLYFGQERVNKLLYLPPLIWQIIRNIRDSEVKTKLYEKLITDRMGIKWMENIKIPASYALLKTRR